MSEQGPLLSVVLTTHDRHLFLPMALACYRHQTYRNRELIVVDDSTIPIDATAVEDAGGQLVRTEPGTPLGVKLNVGFALARGQLFHKMDDDDWYAPDFLERMVAAYTWLNQELCRPVVLCMVTFPFFDLVRWELRMHLENEASGATMVFSRLEWNDSPFRPIPRMLDNWFIQDCEDLQVRAHPVPARESFMQLRHRGHLWIQQPDGTQMADLIRGLPIVPGGPEARLPEWAVRRYGAIRQAIIDEAH